jgi:3-dehydroquinate synthase
MEQRIIISRNIKSELAMAVAECEHDHIFVLVDEVTREKCWSKICNEIILKDATLITIGASDSHKNLDTIVEVWKSLCNNNATRHSCIINIGGGMVTDLGGFAASTFKRGIDFINIPTTLLAMVDASVGGKTGINFAGLKNEIGVFNNARFVIIDTDFLKTLDENNICAGYAEMLKHAIISSEQMWSDCLNFTLMQPDFNRLREMLALSIKVKENIVKQDPKEHGIRKALNFGHTFGHAMESWSLKTNKPLPHGYAVAYGMICELYLSCVKMGFPTEKMRQTVNFIKSNYGEMNFTCNDYDNLVKLMHHDKKNLGFKINFTLLEDVGKIKINQSATDEEIKNALDFYREGE